MESRDAIVSALAEAVADGTSVDWDHAEESAVDPDERQLVQQLRRLAQLSTAARAHASRWGPLEIRGEIGRGTFGTVYRAWDTRLDREVALKLLHTRADFDEPAASTIIHEGRLLARIRNSNVVTVYGADVFDGRVGIWMEFVTGRTLKGIVSEQGPFGAHEAALIGRGLCRALAAVHREGFLHRDIKAQNVMREAGGRTVLMDFGAGKPAADADGAALAGTPAYLAPEVLAGGAADVRSDIYSLGVLLYYLVSGEFPVVGDSIDGLRAQHYARRRRPLRDVRPDLPAAFVRAVDRATAVDAGDRPESAGALEAMLDTALAGTSEHSVAAAESPSLRPSNNRSVATWRTRLAIAATAVLLIAAAAMSAARWRPWTTASDERRNSVAVLPFRNLTATADKDYLSEGITDDVSAHLAALRDLRVVSGASMRQYQDRGKSEQEIGSVFDVATVLDGSVRQVGDRVRIVSRLVDARSGEQIWSESFERDVKDLLTMQAEVTRRIAVAIKGELLASDAAVLDTPRSRDAEAFHLYLKGRYYWGLRTEEGLTRSIELFDEAIARDPKYAAAYAGLADAYTAFGTYGVVPRADAFARAAEAAERAVSLDDSLAEAHAALGYAQKNRFEWQAAEKSLRRAIELKHSYSTAHHWYSIFLTQHGRFPEAITEAKLAVSLDPIAVGPNMQLAAVMVLARRYDDAIAQLERLMAIDPVAASYPLLGGAYTYKRRYDKANDALERAARLRPAGMEDQDLKADVGYLRAVSGERAEAQRIARDLEMRYERAHEEVAGSIAAIYAGLGEVDTAFRWLERAVAVKDPEVGFLKVHPWWDRLRKDRRFAALLQRLGFD